MKDAGKALGTAVIWGGIVALCYMFNSFHLLDGKGAAFMVIAGVIVTLGIWCK